MNNSKIIIYILISLFLFLIGHNFYNYIEGYDNCVYLDRVSTVTDREKANVIERKNLKKVTELERIVNKLIYPLKQSNENSKQLKTIGPMQQSTLNSQSGDVTGNTKLTGL